MKTSEVDQALNARQYREFEIRAFDPATREVEGIAVPWGEIANIGNFTESMERGAVKNSDDAQLWWRHREPIGLIVENRDEDAGWFIRAKISETTLGNDAHTLARDGVVKKFSIGFDPVTWETESREDGTVHVRHTEIRVGEVSLVPLPAYLGADVTNVREGTNRKEILMGADAPTNVTVPAQEWAEMRDKLDGLEQFRSTVSLVTKDEPVSDVRSAAEFLRAMVKGDGPTIDAYNDLWQRAYDGTQGSLQDLNGTLKPAWVGDLTRIIDEASPLVQFFARGTLPDSGMTLEYAQLKSNTVQVEEQLEEYDDLAYGKVTLEIKNAEVHTYGGWSELSRQVIERATISVLDTTLRAQAVASGKRMNKAMRAMFNAAIATQTAANNTIGIPHQNDGTYRDFINAIVDAAVKFDALGLPLDGMLANASLFKYLANLEASDGRPVLLVTGNGQNNVGTINPKALSANIANVEVTLDPGLTALNAAPKGAFANKTAIRSYIGPSVRLQDENIINLSKQFSVYNYAAFANEIPAALVPFVFAPEVI